MDEKTIQVLNCILNNQPLSGPMIVEKLKEKGITINVKTVHANVKKINQFYHWLGNVDIFIKHKINYGYYIDSPFFTKGEYLVLQDMINYSTFLNEDDKKRLMNKISRIEGIRESFDYSFDNESEKQMLLKLTTIKRAIEEKKSIIFNYMDFKLSLKGNSLELEAVPRKNGNYEKDHKNETYLVSPYELMINKGHYYLISYNPKYVEQLTMYRVDRMEFIRTSQSKFLDMRDGFDIEAFKKNLVNMYVGTTEENIKIRFNKDLLKSMLDQFGSNGTYYEDVESKYILVLEAFPISDGLVGWLLMMGDQVEVLEPLSLRENMVSRLKKTLSLYCNH